jgi:hypothetical protein
MRVRLIAASLAAMLLVGGCTIFTSAECDLAQFDPAPRLTCDAALAAARGKLAGVSGVTGLRMQYGLPCPPNARCMAPSGDEATVYATLAAGGEVIVIVTIDATGVVTAQDAQPLPTFLPAAPVDR